MLCGLRICVVERASVYVRYSVLLFRAGSCSVIDHAQSVLSKSSAFHFFYYLSSIESPFLLSSLSYHIISCSRDPKTRKERALRHPHKCLHPRLRTQQPRELPRNTHAYVPRISDHVLRRRTPRSEFRVRSLVFGSLFLKIDLRRPCASVCFRGECIRFSEQPCELAE